jgi:dTDP-4-dehydrorhamnose reductase
VPGGRTNFVKWLAGELKAARRVRIVSDQYNTPTLADDLAGALLALLQRGATGMIHVAGPELLGRYEWAVAIARHYGLDADLIDVVTTAELGQPAMRPLRSGLRTQRAGHLAGVNLRGVEAGLDAMEI